MVNGSLAGLRQVIGGYAYQALAADNAHLKVQFFSDSDCMDMKPDNDRNPSDLNPRENECEVPDHHLPSEGFGFKSIKYSFRGDDWKKHWKSKYEHCSLYAFHQKECEDDNHQMLEPGWTLGNNSVFMDEEKSTKTCHKLSDDNQPPFYALMLNCKEPKKPVMVTSDVIVVATPTTVTHTYETGGSTTMSQEVIMTDATIDAHGGWDAHVTGPTTRVEVSGAIVSGATGVATIESEEPHFLMDPTVTIVPAPGSDGTTTIRPQATVTQPESGKVRRRLHARDVMGKPASSYKPYSTPSYGYSKPSYTSSWHTEPTSVEVVINEEDFFDLIKKLGQDLGEWIDDLESAIDKVDDDAEEVECYDGECQEEGDDLWPCYGDDCEDDSSCDDDSSCYSTEPEWPVSYPSKTWTPAYLYPEVTQTPEASGYPDNAGLP